jgi:catechol 2,3-dioxygenase-like lactoylglutathione lyase family enzyme
MAQKTQLVTLMPIRDMDRAVKFYTKVLGAKLVFRGQGEMKDGWASLTLGDSGIWLISPSKREKRTLAYSTLIVKNIKTFVAGLQANGVKFQKAEKMSDETKVVGPIAFEGIGASAFFKDSEGNVLMLWQDTMDM